MSKSFKTQTAGAGAGKIRRALDRGMELHRRGKLKEAESHYRQVLLAQPGHAGALRLMGVLCHEAGCNEQGIEFLRRALTRDPEFALAHRNIAHLYALTGDNFVALHHYSEAARLDPNDIAAHIEQARILSDIRGEYDAALAVYDKALATAPEDARLHRGRGKVLAELKRNDEAADAMRRAAELAPEDAAIAFHRAKILSDIKRDEEAAEAFVRAAELAPEDKDLWLAYGNALNRTGRKQEAVDALSRAIEIDPEFAAAYSNLGNILADEAMFEEALAAHLRAVALRPDLAEAYNNLGSAYQNACMPAEAVHAYEKALLIESSQDATLWNLALCLLSIGRVEEGWDIYGFGFASGQRMPYRPFPNLLWQGEDLTGKTIMVWREQGVGDELRFSTCIPDLIAEAGHVIIETDPRLVGLYQRTWPEATVRAETGKATGLGNYPAEEIDFDWTAPLGIVASLRRRKPESFPKVPRPLKADPERRRAAREWLDSLGAGPRIGLTWRSGIRTTIRNVFATSPADWAPLAKINGAKLINLQFGEPGEEIRRAAEEHGLVIHEMPGLDTHRDLEGTAALTAELDFMAGLWNAASEMAGALGVPGLIYMPANHSMQLGTGRLPWHPSLRIYPVMPGFDHGELIERIGADARVLLAERASA